MRILEAIAAAGATDAGLQREVNEDRFHIDEARGLFIVIDGIGGQAAGGKAADVALAMLRGRLERETGPIAERVREAIAVANNEIYRLASTRPEWDGMACVLTVAVVKDGIATIGHVGDTRLYRLRDGFIEKITRDHSPVGEREDARELTEFEAMRHPRRNEVYRDVGSEAHDADDPDFVDIHEIPFYAGDALVLCSDGLSDLVDSQSILRTVAQNPHDPLAVAHALVGTANAAGGTDNVTVVYVRGENFDVSSNVSHLRPPVSTAAPLSRKWATRRRLGTGAGIAVVAFLTGLMVYRATTGPVLESPADDGTGQQEPSQIVRPDESIGAALMRAQPGSEVVVEPGEYREQVTLTNNVRLVSRVPRGATIRLPATVSDAEPEPAIIATGSARGELVGFRIVGDARTPLGVGILVSGPGVSLVDVEVSGAAKAAISFARDSAAALIGSDIHDNPGAALTIAAGAAPRITHNVFSRNGSSQHTPATFVIEDGAAPLFQQNVFAGIRPDAFAKANEAIRLKLEPDNWFVK